MKAEVAREIVGNSGNHLSGTSVILRLKLEECR